jgi:hypothetical protein
VQEILDGMKARGENKTPEPERVSIEDEREKLLGYKHKAMKDE